MLMVSLLMECSLFPSQPPPGHQGHHSHTTVNSIFVIAATSLIFPGQRSILTDLRLAVTELLTVCLAEWIVAGHSTLCPAVKTVMMRLVRGCSIISYDDYHIILHQHHI